MLCEARVILAKTKAHSNFTWKREVTTSNIKQNYHIQFILEQFINYQVQNVMSVNGVLK